MKVQATFLLLQIFQQYFKYLPPLRFHKRNKMAHQEGTYQNLEKYSKSKQLRWNGMHPAAPQLGTHSNSQGPWMRTKKESPRRNPFSTMAPFQTYYRQQPNDVSQTIPRVPNSANGNKSVNCKTIKQEF